MARHLAILGVLTIPSGSTASNILPCRLGAGLASDMIIYTPAALTGTVSLQVSPLDSAGAGNMQTLSVDGSDFTLAANKGVAVPTTAFAAIRVLSGSAEGADRVFTVMVQIDM